VGVARAVLVPVLERAFAVRGEVVAAATRALAGRERDLDQISVAIDKETGPAEMRCQPKGAVELLGEHAFGFQRLFGKESAVFVGKSRGDEVGDGVGAGGGSQQRLPPLERSLGSFVRPC